MRKVFYISFVSLFIFWLYNQTLIIFWLYKQNIKDQVNINNVDQVNIDIDDIHILDKYNWTQIELYAQNNTFTLTKAVLLRFIENVLFSTSDEDYPNNLWRLDFVLNKSVFDSSYSKFTTLNYICEVFPLHVINKLINYMKSQGLNTTKCYTNIFFNGYFQREYYGKIQVTLVWNRLIHANMSQITFYQDFAYELLSNNFNTTENVIGWLDIAMQHNDTIKAEPKFHLSLDRKYKEYAKWMARNNIYPIKLKLSLFDEIQDLLDTLSYIKDIGFNPHDIIDWDYLLYLHISCNKLSIAEFILNDKLYIKPFAYYICQVLIDNLMDDDRLIALNIMSNRDDRKKFVEDKRWLFSNCIDEYDI